MKAAGYETYHHGKEGGSAKEIQTRFEHTKYVIFHSELKDGQPGKIIVDDAIDFLSSRSREKPFFMYLALSEPHDPRTPAQEYLDQYKREDIPLPENYMSKHPFDNGELTVRDETLEAWPRTEEAIRKHLHEYYAFITGMDRHLGRLFQALKKSGQMDNTIIIFSSDNGLAIGSHGLMGKQSVYEHSARVPLMIAGPGIPRGSSDALVYLMDIFPTVCELVDTELPGGLDGRSLLPVVRGKAPNVRETLFYSYKNFQRAMRDDRWKVIYYPIINKVQLFDLENDSSEMHDLSGNPGHAGRIAKMEEQLREWQKRLGDDQPLRRTEASQ
jgi:arylsulfatase A-like enzyme